jgi:hypothetical protein
LLGQKPDAVIETLDNLLHLFWGIKKCMIY